MRLALCAVLLLAAGCNDGTTCDTRNAAVGEVCIPAALAPDIGSVLDVRESCGLGCSGTPTCSALYSNGQVVMAVEQDVCSDSFSAGCLNLGCQQRVIRCALPALPAGNYTLMVPGGPARTLHFERGGAASCRFAAADGGVQ